MKIAHPERGEVDVTPDEYEAVYRHDGWSPVEVVAPDLSAMTREELDAYAESCGVADAAKLPNKAAVVEAIEATQPAGATAAPAEAQSTE